VPVPAARADEAGAITENNVDARIETAKSAAEHEALAAHFRAQAKESTEKVKQHQEMLASFKKVGGKLEQNWKQHWKQHCESLIASYRRQAKDYESLAKTQENLAVVVFEITAGREGRESATVDPVCRMQIRPDTAPARLPFGDRTYYFCSLDCARAFAERPEPYLQHARSG
jgi:YHS domain-containing protein